MANLALAPNDVLPSAAAVLLLGLPVVGSPITAGTVVYFNGTGWLPAIAEFASPVGIDPGDIVGIAVNSAWPGQPLAVCLEDPYLQLGDPLSMVPVLTQGETYILSGTGGSGFIAPISDIDPSWYRVVLGTAITGAVLKFERIATAAAA